MKTCKYCDKIGDFPSKAILEKNLSLGILGKTDICVFVSNDKVLGIILGEHDLSVNIKYCPMCGRKLNREAADEAPED